MATINLPFDPVTPPPGIVPTASNYFSAYDFTQKYMPELAPELFQVRSKGSLQGFLASKAMEEGCSADYFFWTEEGERHAIHENSVARSGNVFTLADHKMRPDTLVMIHDQTNDAWGLGRVESTTSTTFTVISYSYADWATAGVGTADLTVLTAGSEFKKGTSGQEVSLEMQTDIYKNKLVIAKDRFKINNSDLTNIAWFKAPDGSYFWYDEQFDITRDRFMDELEVQMFLAEQTDAASALSGDYEGTEGYFTALRNRGINNAGLISSTADWEAIIKTLDKVHAEDTYFAYLSRTQTQEIDKWLAGLSAYDATVGANYGAFANAGADGQEMSLQLGFSGFKWSDYSFFKQTWNLLKDPTKLGSDYLAASGLVHGVLFPYGNTSVQYNQISGAPAKKVPYLTMMYKEMPGYSRKLEQFYTGSGRLATATTSEDAIQFDLRSERGLRTVAARKQIIITGA